MADQKQTSTLQNEKTALDKAKTNIKKIMKDLPIKKAPFTPEHRNTIKK